MKLRTWGTQWLAQREENGSRDAKTEGARWRRHIETTALADVELATISRPMARAWWNGLLSTKHLRTGDLLAAQTCKNTLNLVRCAFEDACEDELVDANVFRELRLPRGRYASSDEKWTVLSLDEQRSVLDVAPIDERHVVAVAMGTGLRRGELWTLHLADVVVHGNPHVVVRFGGFRGGKFRPTKGGKPRRVPLFGGALEAMRAWLSLLPAYSPTNPLGLVFPTRAGSVRRGRPLYGWKKWLAAAKISRRVRWHDLRHTCASSLVGGWWGRAWSLEEVCRLLGHSSIRTTERYAHFADDFLTRAADESDCQRRK